MGFPVGYSDLLLPRFLFLILSFLGHLRKLIAFALRTAGLGDLLLDPADPEPSHGPQHRPDRCHMPLSAASRIRSLLPAVRYGDLGACGGVVEGDDVVPESCAVCLHEFECEDEVRRLSNCRHVFHSGCLDPWVELDQRTCPLCRAALFPDELLCGSDGGASELDWGGSGQPESLPWFLLSSDAAAAAIPDLELW